MPKLAAAPTRAVQAAPAPTVITLSMGASGPKASPNPARVPKNGSVQFVGSDAGRLWAVIMKDGRTPLSNSRKTVTGKGRTGSSKHHIKAGARKGSSYGYWLVYEDAKGALKVRDPRIMITL